ncbi:MAG: LptF/LptG family permease [Isosphaeraceae bacterium]
MATFGILQRYVLREVVRAFALALLTMTSVFVLFIAMSEATKLGLSPRDIMNLIPYVIPGTLPYTVPVSVLFAVTVAYGRLASDNEVIAVKTAGLSAMTVLWPAIVLGAALSGALLYFSGEAIPRANHLAKLAIIRNFEDGFYKWLKVNREFNNPEWPFLVMVHGVDVETRTMYKPTFKHRDKKAAGTNTFDMIVQAEKAIIKFDLDKGVARVYLEGAETAWGSNHDDVFIINDKEMEIDIPDKNRKGLDKRIQEWTTAEMVVEQSRLRRDIARERKRQAMAAALWFGSGRINRVDWFHIQEAFVNYGYWGQRLSEFETEKQLRVAQSFSSLIFVLLGAPVGILFARRDFMSAFISCFVPIIILYYPLMLLGVNLGKEDVVPPVLALWGGNVLLSVLAGLVLPPVIRH